MITYKNYNETNFITGLRAYAILLVILIHSGGAGLRSLGEIGKNIVEFGQAGVFIFFVISGFAITESFIKDKTVKTFLIRRFFRIAPLFYAVIILCLILDVDNAWQRRFEHAYSLHNLFMHFTFLFMFDYTTALTIPGVEWTLGVEVFWYIVAPFILIFSKDYKRAALVLIAVALVTHFSQNIYIKYTEDPELSYHLSPLKYGYAFLAGMLTSYIRRKLSQKELYKEKKVQITFEALTIISVISFFLFITRAYDVDLALYFCILFSSLIIIIVGGTNNRISSFIFENKVTIFIGTISYSLYLLHFVLLEFLDHPHNKFLFFLTCLASSVLVSFYSYKYIEIPSNKFAKKLVNKK